MTDRDALKELTHDPIANLVRRNGDEDAAAGADRSTAQGKFRQTLGRRDQAQGETLCGHWGELADIVANSRKIALRAPRPDDPVQYRQSPTLGGGSSSAVPQDNSHAFMAW